MLYGIESHGIIPTTINSVDTRTIDVGAVSKNGQNLELPPGGNFYREAAASAADRTVWALVYLCTRLELSLFFIRDRFLDEWLPTISSAGVIQPVASWDCMLCSYRDSMMGASSEALLRGCKTVSLLLYLLCLKFFT
jgi:hypothetical protein